MNKYTNHKISMIPIRKFIIIFTLLLSSLGANSLYAQVIGDYRSVADGLWSVASNWEVCTSPLPAGGTWAPAIAAPGDTATPTLVTIRHDVTVNFPMQEDLNNITVEASKTLSFSTYSSLRRRGSLTLTGACPECAAKLYLLAVGDYRNSSSGEDWGISANWEKYNGTAWVVAPEYPGVNLPATSTVFVRTISRVNLDVSPANELNRLVIENGGTFATPTCNALLAKTVNTYGNYFPTVGTLITLNAGDIRSTGAAAWDVVGSWQEYNGTTWGAAPAEYPGQTPTAAQRDRDVIVLHTMTLGATITNPSGNIYVASGGGITGAFNLTVTTLTNCGIINSMTNIVYGINRYESVSNGDWSDITVWRASTDGGATWSAATQYPGQAAPSATQVVTIMATHTVTLDISPFEDVRDIVVNGTMNVSNNSTVRYTTGTCTGCPLTATKLVADGDYRSKATGNWGVAATWQKRVAGAWVDAPEYPGVLAASTAQVFTRAPHNISLNLTPAEEIHTLIVESGSTFAANTCNHLRLLNTPSLNGIYNATLGKYIIINNGDFRSMAAGSWNINTTWEQFDTGTNTWVPAPAATFPGSGLTSVKNVIIRHAVTLNATPIEDIQELLIETASSLSISGLFNLRYRGAYTNCGTYNAGSGGIHKVNNNDFRNILAGGDWNLTATWERYNGTTWVGAAVFPGQNASVGETVFVRNNVTTTVTATPPNSISGLVLENHATTTLTINTGITLTATGTVALYGTLNQVGTGILNYENIGDYRTTGTSAKNGDWRTAIIGDWDMNGKWEKFNGSTWAVQGTAFPGQDATAIGATIFIAHTTALNLTPASSIGGLIVNNGITLTVNTSRTLTVNGIYGRIGTGTVTLLGTLNITSNWSNIEVWEKLGNTGWGASADYPGQNFSIIPPRVSVRTGHIVATDLSPLHDIQNVTIAGTLTFTGTLGTDASTLRSRTAHIISGGTCTDCPTRVLVIANGDYRSKATGNWQTAMTWEKFVGNAWIDAPEAPGDIDPTSNTSRVFIRNTHTITLGQTPFNDVGQAFVERGGTYTISPANSLRARTTISVNGTYTANGGSYFVLANGDYRSIASTDWSAPATWERYDGTTWVNPATVYPGQDVASYGSVYIRRGHTVVHNISPLEDINAFTIENGGILNVGTCYNLTMRGNFTILGTTSPALDNLIADRFIRIQNLDYRSNVATGNWSAAASWQKFVAGTWSGAPEAPGVIAPVLGQNVIIRTGHNITFDANPAFGLVDIYVVGQGATVADRGTLTDGGATSVQISGRNVTDAGQQCGLVTEPAATFNYFSRPFYRTIAGGLWSDPAIWQTSIDGVTWDTPPASSYPGERQFNEAVTPTSQVTVRNGHTVTVNISPPENIINLRIDMGGILDLLPAANVGHNIKVRTPISNAGNINNLHSNTIPNITVSTAATPVPNTGTFTFIPNGAYRTVASGNWNNLNIWQVYDGGVPKIWRKATQIPGGGATSAIDIPVIIRPGHTVAVDISMAGTAATNQIGNLIVENGATLTAQANSNVAILGSFINHGTFAPTAGAITFVLNGTSNISGASLLANYAFYDLVMNRTGGTAVSTSKSFGISNSFRNISTATANVFLASSPSIITFNAGGTASISGVANIASGTFPATTFNNPISFHQVTINNTTVNVSTPIRVTENLRVENAGRVINTSEIVITKDLSSDGNIASIFVNATNGYLRYRSGQTPFLGASNALDASTATNNMVDYDFVGNQTLYAASYHTLRATNGGTKTMDVTTIRYDVRSLFTISKGATRTTVVVNGTTGRLLNFRANVGLGCTYTYNANTNTIGMNNLPKLNGPGLPANDFASNFSGRFNSIYTDDGANNGISSSNLNDIRFDRGGSGSMRAVRSIAIPDVPQAAVVRFDVVGASNSSVVTDAANIVIGNALMDDDAMGANVASRLSFGFGSGNNINFIHRGATNSSAINLSVPSTTTSRRRVAWFINTSGAMLTYTNPSGGTNTLANNRVDIWVGTTISLADAPVTNNGVSLNSLKIVFYNGTGSFTLENIRINPIALLTVNNYTQEMLSGTVGQPLCITELPYVIKNMPLLLKDDAGYTTVSSSPLTPNSAYNPNNQFLIQLSRPDGAFINPLNGSPQFTQIGALSSTNPSSLPNVVLTIPENIQPTMIAGNAFRIRIVSTDPPMVSTPSANNLTIRSYSIVRNSDNTVPPLKAIATTEPNQFTELLKINGVPLDAMGVPILTGFFFQWKVRHVISGMVHTIPSPDGTGFTFRGDGTKTSLLGHFPYGTGRYDLFCEVITPVSVGCGMITTASVPIIVECTGCTKNPRPYDACVKNLVFNGTFEGGVWGRSPTDGTIADTPVFPESMPNPDDPNSEGMIPFETGSSADPNPYGGIVPDIRFSPYQPPYGNLAVAPNPAQARRQKMKTYILANGQPATLRLNTPYGFSTEYGGGTNATNFQPNMSVEAVPGPNPGAGTGMGPENTWAVSTNPGLYHGNFCDATGKSVARRGTTNWTSTSPPIPPSMLPVLDNGTAGVPFLNFPTKISVATPAGLNALFPADPNGTYNSSPSGGRMEVANGSVFVGGKMWAQRFKVRKNTDYVFSFWAANMNSIEAIYGVYVDCSQIGNHVRFGNNVVGDRCIWKQYTFLWNSGDRSTAEFSVRNVTTVPNGHDFAIDDVMFYRCDNNTNLFPSENKFVWRGLNTDWFNPDNWGNCILPDCESDVIIPAESTNPAASTLLGTYYMPIIRRSTDATPSYTSASHPANNLADPRNLHTSNLAKVKTITIEHGATLTIGTNNSMTPWNLDICGDLIAKKNAAADPDIVIDWLNPATPAMPNPSIGITHNQSSITFTSTTLQAAEVSLAPAKISGDFRLQGTATNQLPTFIVRKRSVNQVVQLDDHIEVHGDLVIIDGTLDANEKNILFRGGQFVNGSNNETDATNNPKSIGNTHFVYPPSLATVNESSNGPNTTSGASFVHNTGTVTFQSLSGNQTYYKREKIATPLCPTCVCPNCEESFYNLIINQEATTSRNLDIIRGDLIINNNLRLANGYITAKVNTGAREVYITNPDATTSLTLNSMVADREKSYVVTTNNAFTPLETNLKLRREINGLDFATKDYIFPVGGDNLGNPAGTVLTGYRELIFRQTTAISFVSSVRAYFDARNSSAAYSMPKLPGARSDASCPITGENLTYDLCTGGYWDLKPLNDLGGIESPTGISYNLTMPSIPAAFACTGTPTRITFVKRTNEADDWGFGASCWVNPQTRTGFNTFTKYAPVSTITLLPVEFLSFDAFKNNQNVDVKWETISERNSSHFIVQRSADGKNFIPVGRVEANGNTTSTVKYLFVDTKPMQGINYYRLLQVDLDGKETLTKVVSITFNGDDADLQVFPNPSSEGIAFNVILPASIAGSEVEMRMTDAVGRQMLYQRFRFEGGTIQLPAGFAKGLYTLTIATPKENYVRKLIIK